MKTLPFLLKTLRSMALVLPLSLSFIPIQVSAATQYNETVQFADDFDSCSGERVFIQGSQHVIGRFTADSAGKLHFGLTRATKGTGIGQVSGDDYLLTDAVARASLELVSGEVNVLTEQYNSRLIHQGEGWSNDDTIIHFISKITITAEGIVNSTVEFHNVECL